MLRASRVGLLSTRYEITRDGVLRTTWKPSPFLGGGAFRLDGRAYDVTRGGWNGRRWRLRDASRAVLAVADGVGRAEWTLDAGGVVLGFARASERDHDQVARRDRAEAGRVHRDTVWTGEATADLPGLPTPVQVFVLVTLLSVWDED